jgi:hypothetical protein
MAWMLLAFVMALTRITMAHCDAVRRGHPSHQQSRVYNKPLFSELKL